MIKGIVIDNLFIRSFGASVGDTPEDFLEPGEEILIERAVYGDLVSRNGESSDKWYVMDNGEFIWSGCVATEEELNPITKRVIFTSDDYGVVDTINQGVKNAVKDGSLNSVACFTNFGKDGIDSYNNIAELQNVIVGAGKTVELGVHLTFTSGSPIIGREKAFLLCQPRTEAELNEALQTGDDKARKDYNRYLKLMDQFSGKKVHQPELECDFRSVKRILKNYKALTSANKKKYLEQLEEELKAQLNVFLDPPGDNDPIPIAHITSHHNTVFFNDDFFEIIKRISEGGWIDNEIKTAMKDRMQFPIPIRSLNNSPTWKDYLYTRFRAMHTGEEGKWLKGPLKSMERLAKNLCTTKIKSPGFLNSQHYGPLPMSRLKGISFIRQVKKKKNHYIKMLDELRWDEYHSMEFLLHIRAGEVYKKQKDYFDKEIKQTGYGGIDFKGFDSRTAEFEAISKSFQKGLPKGVILGNWKDLKEKEGCRNHIRKMNRVTDPNIPDDDGDEQIS